MRIFVILAMLLFLSGCAHDIAVRDCLRTVDKNGQVTPKSLCVYPGWFE